MSKHLDDTAAARFFSAALTRPRSILAAGILVILATLVFIPTITMDTTADAFMPADHPAMVYKDIVEEEFKLKDPVVIAIIDDSETGIFRPATLNLALWLTERVKELELVDPANVTSIATLNNIVGTYDGLLIDPFYEERITEQEHADRVGEAVMSFDLFHGSIIAHDRSATLIVVELDDVHQGGVVYDEIMGLIDEAPVSGQQIHVAGEGAVNNLMGQYITNDAMRLNPLSGLIVSLILFFTFRTLRGVLVPNLVVLGAVSVAMGTMAAAGDPMYVITNALPVLLIAIGVADSIHIMSHYYEEFDKDPGAKHKQIIVRAMVSMWRPVLITSITTIGGFYALTFASFMPPMRAFGIYASMGVTSALLYSLFVLPSTLMLLKPQPSPAFSANVKKGFAGGIMSSGLRFLGRRVAAQPGLVIVVAVFIAIIGAMGALKLQTDDNRIENINNTEPIYVADGSINDRLDGTKYLDIVIETPEAKEGIFYPERLHKIELLQRWLKRQEHVGGSTSVVDFIKKMNMALNEDRREEYRIPDSQMMISQEFLLYTASGDPGDFEEYIDFDYSRANVRVRLQSGWYSDIRRIVDTTQSYLNQHFNAEDGMTASLSGPANIDYHWLGSVTGVHFYSLGIALIGVVIVSAVSFRSLVAGLLTTIPVTIALLFIYALMGYGGIYLGIGTSMFAAIAIGTGVDFATHTIDRLRQLIKVQNLEPRQAFRILYSSTGRALLFSFLALLFGFGLLMVSSVPPLYRFGAVVSVASIASFLASMTVLPAIVMLTRPSFFGYRKKAAYQSTPGYVRTGVIALLMLFSGISLAEDLPTGKEIVEQVDARDDGIQVTRNLHMKIIDKSGKERDRQTIGYRKYFGEEKRTVLFFTEPRNLKGSSFMTWDYPEANKDDDQWIYLPALRKVRRISASDRGDYFFGTDLTYEDIKMETKISLDDYTF